MSELYKYIANIENEIVIPAEGILSKTLLQNDRLKLILFGFAKDEELSEHTASMPAIFQILQGKAKITLGEDQLDSDAGTWIWLPANLSHSIRAQSPMAMLLLLLKSG